jgi:hypothetical protein
LPDTFGVSRRSLLGRFAPRPLAAPNLLWVSLLCSANVLSCTSDEKLVIGTLEPGPPPPLTGEIPCASERVVGPGGYEWCTVADPGASSEWSGEPTASAVQVEARSPREAGAGMGFSLNPRGEVEDLSGRDRLSFDGDIPDDTPFEVFIGRGRNTGCSFFFSTGKGRGRYDVDLRYPSWCVPSLCQYDLQASFVLFLDDVTHEGEARIEVSSVTWRDAPSSSSISAMNASTGPGRYCWFPFAWGSGASSQWVGSPSEKAVEFIAESPRQELAGVAFELPAANFRLSSYRRLDLKGYVAEGTPFLVQGVRGESGFTWRLLGSGAATYSVDLTGGSPFGSPRLRKDEAERIEIATPYLEGGALKARFTDARFVE